MYCISFPDQETLDGNPWWESGGELLIAELSRGPFSIDENDQIRPALPFKIKQSYNTSYYWLWEIDPTTNDYYKIIPSWICFEIMRMAQLIKNFDTCPLKFKYINDDKLVLIKKPADSKLNASLEEESAYECGVYYIFEKSWLDLEHLKQFKPFAIPFNEELLMRAELASLPINEYDMSDMVEFGEQSDEEEYNEAVEYEEEEEEDEDDEDDEDDE